jgi:glycosyltransferase involved in cell wall biosynthesis
VLTREDPARFAELCQQAKVDLVTRSVVPAEVPSYLSASDVGLCFRHRFPSQLSCSPIKLAEYLACGLPVVSTSGCGDYDELIETKCIGTVIKSDGDEAYLTAARDIERLLAEETIGERCRFTARLSLGLKEVVAPRYSEIYRALAGSKG